MLDSVNIHKGDEVMAISGKCNVKLLPLTKNFTYMMQPLDVYVFKGAKALWKQQVLCRQFSKQVILFRENFFIQF